MRQAPTAIAFALGSVAGLIIHGQKAAAQSPPPNYGIDFVTVGSPGNPGYNGPDPDGNTVGRGGVGYEFRIGRTEITTGQYLEFYNTFAAAANPPAYFNALGPTFWGARRDLSYAGPGWRYELRNAPDAAMLPVGGIGWFDAALYCNWLQNGKQSSPTSLLNGAYDTSLWVFPWTPGGPNISWAHQVGARYWIPTLDESLKAQHYDPNRNGPGLGGWWLSKNSSDQAGTPGPPGIGGTSAGYSLPNWGEWEIPLGSYPQSRSPWGLLDTSGGAQEWTESISNPTGGRRSFTHTGSYAGMEFFQLWDTPYGHGDAGPGGIGSATVGFRVASAVPSPGSFIPLCVAGFALVRRPTRREKSADFPVGLRSVPVDRMTGGEPLD